MIRPILQRIVPLFGITACKTRAVLILEAIQRRAIRIIYPSVVGMSHVVALAFVQLMSYGNLGQGRQFCNSVLEPFSCIFLWLSP